LDLRRKRKKAREKKEERRNPHAHLPGPYVFNLRSDEPLEERKRGLLAFRKKKGVKVFSERALLLLFLCFSSRPNYEHVETRTRAAPPPPSFPRPWGSRPAGHRKEIEEKREGGERKKVGSSEPRHAGNSWTFRPVQ